MVKVADPPAVMVCVAGVTVKFGGLDSINTVPLPPPVKVMVTGAEPPFLWIEIKGVLITGTQMIGDGFGEGDAPGEGLGDAPGEGLGDGDAPGEGLGEGDAPGEGLGEGDAPGEGLGDAPGEGDGVGVGLAFGSGWSITASPDTFAFRLMFGMSES